MNDLQVASHNLNHAKDPIAMILQPISVHYSKLIEAIKTIDQTMAPLPPQSSGLSAISASELDRIFSPWANLPLSVNCQHYLTLDHLPALISKRAVDFDQMKPSPQAYRSRFDILWEDAPPGHTKINYGKISNGPFGDMLALATDKGLCGLAFIAERGAAVSLDDFKNRWSGANFYEDKNAVSQWGHQIFDPSARIPLHVIGTTFQHSVWEHLLQLPFGHVTTYSDLARHAGVPSSQRAIGSAIGRNPVSWLIPCHRVLSKSGGLGGYRWGAVTKRLMLAWEAAQIDTLS